MLYCLNIQQINATQNENGDIIVHTFSGDSADNRIPRRGDNIDVDTYLSQNRTNNDNSSVNNNNINNINNIDNCDYISVVSSDSDDNSDNSSEIDDINSNSGDSSAESSDSSDSSDYSSDGESEIVVTRVNKRNSKGKRKSNRKIKISTKQIRKALKSDKNKLKSNKYAYKLSREILEKHPRWHNLLPVLTARYKLNSSNFWKGFKSIKLAEIPGLLFRCIITLIRRRAKAYNAPKIILRDLRAVEKFMDKALVHTTGDISTAGVEFINQIKDGINPEKAFNRVKQYFIDYKKPGIRYDNNNGNNNKYNKIQRLKLCKDFNFGDNGCIRQRCKFYSGHICAYCGSKYHGIRNCAIVPNMVIGSAPNLPSQPQQYQRKNN